MTHFFHFNVWPKRTFLYGVWFFSSCACAQVMDADGNSYDTVHIGTQVWLNANLRTTHFSNGDPIPTTYPATLDVSGESNPIYQWAYNGDESLVPVYGRLYTGYVVVDPRNVCPTGWHVPSTPEFIQMENYLGGSEVAGGKLKETGYEHWNYPNTGATNEAGFNGVPNGNRNHLGYFSEMGIISDMWTSTTGVLGNFDRDLYYDKESMFGYDDPLNWAFAIRCVRDLPAENDLSAVTLGPVPAQQELYVNAKNNTGVRFRIFSVHGTLVQEGELVPGVNMLALHGLPAGIYFLQCYDEQLTKTLRFVIAP